jgi:hypothetical protein
MTLLLDLRDQTFADQNRVLSRHELPAPRCTRRLGRGRDCQPLDSDVLANKESASTRSAISVPQGCGVIGTEFSVGTAGRRLEGRPLSCYKSGMPKTVERRPAFQNKQNREHLLPEDY